MSVRLEQDVIHLAGVCAVDEAEALLALLRSNPSAAVDVTAADHLHAALVQLLLVFRPHVVGEPADLFTRTWLLPRLRQATP